MEKVLKQIEKKNRNLYVEVSSHQKEILMNPLSGSQLKGDLKEFRSYDFKFQQVSLRFCYAYNEYDDHVIFVYLGTRENFYREVKRYVN